MRFRRDSRRPRAFALVPCCLTQEVDEPLHRTQALSLAGHLGSRPYTACKCAAPSGCCGAFQRRDLALDASLLHGSGSAADLGDGACVFCKPVGRPGGASPTGRTLRAQRSASARRRPADTAGRRAPWRGSPSGPLALGAVWPRLATSGHVGPKLTDPTTRGDTPHRTHPWTSHRKCQTWYLEATHPGECAARPRAGPRLTAGPTAMRKHR